MKYHALENYDKPRDGLFQVITDSYWIVDEQNRPLVYTKANAPQCNANEAIAKRVANGRPVVRFPIVFLPVNASDFA